MALSVLFLCCFFVNCFLPTSSLKASVEDVSASIGNSICSDCRQFVESEGKVVLCILHNCTWKFCKYMNAAILYHCQLLVFLCNNSVSLVTTFISYKTLNCKSFIFSSNLVLDIFSNSPVESDGSNLTY